MAQLDQNNIPAITLRIVEAFITKHRPDETFLLSSLPRFIGRLSAGEADSSGRAVTDFGLPVDGGTGGPRIATPYATMTVWAVLQELRQLGLEPTRDKVESVVRHAAQQFGATKPLIEELAMHLTAQLMAEFGSPTPPTEEIGSETYIVEWFDRRCGPMEEPTPEQGSFGEPDVESRFRKKRSQFDLFVDEPRLAIYIAGSKENRWPLLEPQQCRFLFQVLQAFKRRFLPYDMIEPNNDRLPEKGRSRTKSELNNHLGGILNSIVKAKKGAERYSVEGQFPYCWIRRSNEPSLLAAERSS